MINLNLDYDEGIVLESRNVSWASRDDENFDDFALTNKRLYCSYKKGNGLFKKATSELCVLALSDIKIINGQAQVQQMKYKGEWCLQIQFIQGTEYFSFSDAPKKTIPQWVSTINNVLGITVVSTTSKASKRSNPFSSAFAEVADNFRNAIDTATQTFAPITKPSMENPQIVTPNYMGDVQSSPRQQQFGTAQTTGGSFCVKCGAKLSPGTNFCPLCGFTISSNNDSANVSYNPPVGDVTNSAVVKPAKNEQQNGIGDNEHTAGAYAQRQQEYVGKIFKCPNCGNTVNMSDIVCEVCGFRLTGKKATSSAVDFQQKLLEVEMTRQKKRLWDKREDIDTTDKQIIVLVKSYPIPNTIDDIIEFFHLAIANIDVNKSKKSVWNTDESGIRAISDAWVGKMQSIYAKAAMYFPNEPEFHQIKEVYDSITKQLKMK